VNKAQQTKFERLYQLHVKALRRQGKAPSTIDVYSRAVRRIAQFFDRCPDRLSEAEFKHYFDALVQSHSWSTVKVDRNGLQFFYKHVLDKQWLWVDIIKPPRTKTLPDILTVKEIERLINGARELRYQTFILVAYTMGLRLGEALSLSVGDIDGERMKVHVRLGKGKKDRFVILPQVTLDALRQYWLTHRNPAFIFPCGKHTQDKHIATCFMPRSGVQKAIKSIVKSCGIHKAITTHSLRHCYGTHLLEAGLNLRAIQHEMGHESPKTTALYTQLTSISHDNSEAVINALVRRLAVTLGGEV
jgi:integrase/recombinase XerD